MDINRNYAVISISDIDNVIFSEILNDSSDTVRINNDRTKFIIGWESKINPTFFQSLTENYTIYSYSEILAEINKPEWNEEV